MSVHAWDLFMKACTLMFIVSNDHQGFFDDFIGHVLQKNLTLSNGLILSVRASVHEYGLFMKACVCVHARVCL